MKIINRILIEKEIRIQRKVFFIEMVYFFFALPYYLVQEISQKVEKIIETGVLSSEYDFDMFSFESLISIFMPIMLAFAIYLGLSFANEKNKKTMEEMARMPFSRSEIYFSKVLVSLVMLALPLLINAGLFVILASRNSGYNFFVQNGLLLYAVIFSILTTYFVYFFFVMFSMLFGSVWGSFISTGVFFTFPVSIFGLIYANLDISGYRSDSFLKFLDKLMHFTPAYYLVYQGTIPISRLLILIGFIIIFMLLGYHMFMVYKMEKNSEFLTFRWTEKVFRIGVVICSVLLGRLMFDTILSSVGTPTINRLIGIAIGGVLGYIIPKKMIEKSRIR